MPKPARRWIVLAAVVVTILVAGRLVIAWYSSPEYLERRLSTALADAGDSLYRITIGSTRTSLLASTFAVTDLSIAPDSEVLRRWREAGRRPRTQYTVDLPSLELDGVGFWGLLHGRISVGSVELERPALDVTLDRTVPSKVQDSVPLPHQTLRGLDWRVHIASIKVYHGDFRYSERAIDGARFGRLRFQDVGVALSTLSNEPPASAPSPPIQISLSALVAGQGNMDAAMEYDIASPKLTMNYHGAVGRMDAKGFNDMMENLEGAQITGGRLDSVWFDVRVADDVATGWMKVLYHDLGLKMVRKVTGDQGLDEIIKTFLNKNFKLKAENPEPGQSPRTAPIHLARQPDVRLIKFLWRTMRQGVMETLGL